MINEELTEMTMVESEKVSGCGIGDWLLDRLIDAAIDRLSDLIPDGSPQA